MTGPAAVIDAPASRTAQRLESMLNDVRYALRSFLKTPGLTAVILVTLALGIGTNTAIFSVVYGVLLRPLPYPRPDDLVQIWNTTPDEPRAALAAADFLELQHDNHSLARVAGYREDAYTVAMTGREPVRISGALVTVDYFDVLGVRAALGRTFGRAADAGTAEPLVVLSDDTWRHHFAADPTVVNTRVRINGVPHTVVGVMPAGTGYPEEAQAWVLSSKPVPVPPIDVAGDLLASRGVHYIKAIGRLRPGVNVRTGTAGSRGDCGAAGEPLRREQQRSRDCASAPSRRDCRRRPRSVAAAARRCRSRAVDCMRECCQPAARPRIDAPARDRDSRGARGTSGPACCVS